MIRLLTCIFLLTTIKMSAQSQYGDIATIQKESVFAEDFNDNTKNWAISNTTHFKSAIANGRYQLQSLEPKTKAAFQTIDIDQARDFEIEYSMRYVSGEKKQGDYFSWGRSTEGALKFFSFFTAGNERYQVTRYNGDTKEWEKFVDWTASDLIYKSAFSIYTIRKVGQWYYYFINHVLVHKMPFEPFYGDRTSFSVGNLSTIEIDYLYVNYIDGKSDTKNEPPALVITSPALDRGFMQVQDETIDVEGVASDADGIAEVRVNGMEARLTADGSFWIQVPLVMGSNVISIIAKDNQQKTTYKSITINRLGEVVANAPFPQKRMALIIGNANYPEGGELKNPVNDARAMKSALTDLGFEVIQLENLDQAGMKRAIDDFGSKLEGYNVALFFYAGHGVQVGGNNYLVPSDAKIDSESDVEYNCVRADRVLAKMEDAGSDTNIIILDACRNNPFERSWTRSARGEGLAFMNAPSGSLVAYATAPGTTASDGAGFNGLYTEALLEHIYTPQLSIEQVFKRVRGTVSLRSNGKQTPWESTSLTGNFIFR